MRTATAAFVLCLIAVVPVASAGGGVLAIDADHPLARDHAIGEYRSTGAVSAEVPQIELTVTVAEEHQEVGLEGAYSDLDTTYLRLEYDEELSRTVRVYLPAAYFTPRPKQDLDAVESDVAATLEPTPDRNYTAVTVHFSGQTDAVFLVSKEAGIVFGSRAEVRDLVSNETGVDVPSVTTDGQWSYVPANSLTANRTYAIATNGSEVTLQYDTDPAANETDWIAIPACSDDDSAPVCRFRRDGEPGRVYLLSRSTSTPEVRYKIGNAPLADLGSAVSDLLSVPSDIGDSLGSLLDGLLTTHRP